MRNSECLTRLTAKLPCSSAFCHLILRRWVVPTMQCLLLTTLPTAKLHSVGDR